jgi:hypothetical protein
MVFVAHFGVEDGDLEVVISVFVAFASNHNAFTLDTPWVRLGDLEDHAHLRHKRHRFDRMTKDAVRADIVHVVQHTGAVFIYDGKPPSAPWISPPLFSFVPHHASLYSRNLDLIYPRSSLC